MSIYENRLRHYQQMLRIQSKPGEKQALIARLHKTVDTKIKRGDIRCAAKFLEDIIEIDSPGLPKGFSREKDLETYLAYKISNIFYDKQDASSDLPENLKTKIKEHINNCIESISTSKFPHLKCRTVAYLLSVCQEVLEAKKYFQLSHYLKNKHIYSRLGYDSLESLHKVRCKKSPDFLVIGVGKGGSSSIYRWIVQHPFILEAITKELHFFNTQRYQLGESWYQAQFPRIPQGTPYITGEATPWYYAQSGVAEKIKHYNPEIKLIIALRNPCDRAISQYYMNRKLGRENRSLLSAIKSERSRLENLSDLSQLPTDYWNFEYGALLFGLYSKFLEGWLKHFPREQFLILKSEDLFKTPESELSKIFEFLDLPEYNLQEYPKYNAGSYKPVDTEVHQTLVDFYRPHNQELEDLLGMKFGWDEYYNTPDRFRVPENHRIGVPSSWDGI